MFLRLFSAILILFMGFNSHGQLIKWSQIEPFPVGVNTWEDVMNRGNRSARPIVLDQTGEAEFMGIIYTKDSLLEGEIGIVNSQIQIPDELGINYYDFFGFNHKNIPATFLLQSAKTTIGDELTTLDIRVSEISEEMTGITMLNNRAFGTKGIEIQAGDASLLLRDDIVRSRSVINYSDNFPIDSPYTLVYKQYVDSLFSSGGGSDNWNDVMNRGNKTDKPIILKEVTQADFVDKFMMKNLEDGEVSILTTNLSDSLTPQYVFGMVHKNIPYTYMVSSTNYENYYKNVVELSLGDYMEPLRTGLLIERVLQNGELTEGISLRNSLGKEFSIGMDNIRSDNSIYYSNELLASELKPTTLIYKKYLEDRKFEVVLFEDNLSLSGNQREIMIFDIMNIEGINSIAQFNAYNVSYRIYNSNANYFDVAYPFQDSEVGNNINMVVTNTSPQNLSAAIKIVAVITKY